MREKIIYDDFTGFTFNGKHSSQFGLLRVSDSDRYEDDLVLSLSDESAEVPGGVGEYYWGETIKKREFKINVAYDSVTELEKREIKQWLHPDDKLHELIFDEKPYVKYFVKCSKQIASKELCFNENGKRVYKGEFEIEFTAYMPYGVARWKTIDEDYITGTKPIPDNYGNLHEWFSSSGLRTNLNDYNFFNSPPNHFLSTKVYNPGDVPTDFVLKFTPRNAPVRTTFKGTEEDGAKSYTMVLNTIEKLENNIKYAIFNPTLHNLYGEKLEEISLMDSENNVISTGYIENINNRPFYIDNNNGEKYEIYYEKFFDKAHAFNLDSKLGLKNRQKYYGIFVNESGGSAERPFYIEDGQFIWILDETSIENNQYNLMCLNFPYDMVIEIQVERQVEENNTFYSEVRSMKLHIPSGTNTISTKWTDVQKGLFEGEPIKIDTSKKLIYCGDKTVGNILEDGDFFKIPNEKLLAQTEPMVFTVKEISGFSTTLSDVSINYDYLYI